MISSMLQYIQKSPDCFHAVENLRQRLMGEGYTQLTAGEWSLTPGGKYFITKNGSSLLAFRVPQGAPTGFVLTASHSDSPCFGCGTMQNWPASLCAFPPSATAA